MNLNYLKNSPKPKPRYKELWRNTLSPTSLANIRIPNSLAEENARSVKVHQNSGSAIRSYGRSTRETG
jgi:hypothetical protein